MDKQLLKSPIRRFMKTKVNSGIILLFVSVLAIIIANSPLKELYDDFFSKRLILEFGGLNLFSAHGEDMTFMAFINDALMALFFFSAGLEIKREMLAGELSSVKKALLPVVAACGGMIVPIVIFSMIVEPGAAARGAAIPMATDIAFSLGVLSLLGKKVPLSLKIFLTAFAVVDDIGGIIVIALFYSSDIVFSHLIYAAIALLLLWIGGRAGIYSKLFYAFLGVFVWYQFLNSGVHATIAGVLVAFTVPARPKLKIYKFITEIKNTLQKLPQRDDDYNPMMLTSRELSTLKYVETCSDNVISPLQSINDDMHSLITYVVMPLFAFANAGITFGDVSIESMKGITSTIFLSLVFGKLIGIFSFTWISTKLGFLQMPRRMNTKNLLGISLLGGVGFTVSLFIANLSYADVPELGAQLLNEAKLGIITGSTFAGILGYAVLRYVLKEEVPETDEEIEKELDS